MRVWKWNSFIEGQCSIIDIKSDVINLLYKFEPFILTFLEDNFDRLEILFEIILKTLILFFHGLNIREKTSSLLLKFIGSLSQLNKLLKVFIFDRFRRFIIKRIMKVLILFLWFLNFIKRIIDDFDTIVRNFIRGCKFIRIITF